MQKRILSFFLAIVMVLGMLPGTALTSFAAGDGANVASVTSQDKPTTYYTDLQVAIDAAVAGDRVNLLANIVGTTTYTVGAQQNIAIDLNGYTLQNTAGNALVVNGATVEILGTNGGAIVTDSGIAITCKTNGHIAVCDAITVVCGTKDSDHVFSLENEATASIISLGGRYYKDPTSVGVALSNGLAISGSGDNWTVVPKPVVSTAEVKYGASADASFTEGTLAEAIAANAAYIQLLENITSDSTLYFQNPVTIDLNGKTLTVNTDQAYAVEVYGDLTITDTSDAKNGSLCGASSGESGRGVYATGGITVEGGSLSGESDNYLGVQGNSITVTGGTLRGESGYYAVYSHNSITVTGGSLSGAATGSSSVGVYAVGTITVSGGELTASCDYIGVYSDGTVTVSGEGKITATGATAVQIGNETGSSYTVESEETDEATGVTTKVLTARTAVTPPDSIGKIVIVMHDSYGDGWNGAAINIYKNDVRVGKATIEDGDYGVFEMEYVETAQYRFTWTPGNYDSECTYTIYINGEEYTGDLGTEEDVSVTGDTVVGQTLTAETSGFDPAEELKYQWYRAAENNTLIDGATERTYTLTETDLNHKIYCVVNGVESNRVGPVVTPAVLWGTSADASLTEGTLAAAIEANAAYIQLLEDITSDSTLTFNNSVTIDLNGRTLTVNTDQAYAVEVLGDLTITDTSDAKNGSLCGASSGEYGYGVCATGGITVEDGSLSGESDNYIGVLGNSITVTGGTLRGESVFYAVYSYNDITVESGSLSGTAEDSDSIGVCSEGNITVSGGTLSGTAALYGIYSYKGITVLGEGKITATGSDAVAGEDEANFSYTVESETTDSATGLTTKVLVKKAEAPANSVASVTTAGDVTTDYTDIGEAIAAAKASEGSTLTLLEDITTTTVIEINSGSFTIDLNGKTWQRTSYLMYICGNADIKIIDSSTEKSGKLLCTGSAYTITLYGNANLEFAGGTVESNNVAIAMDEFGGLSQATLTVSGGKVVTTGNYAISAYGASVTVIGGTIESGHTDIYYKSGTIDLSGHSNPTGITIYNDTGAEVTPGENTIRLPEDYVLLDSIGNAATTLMMGNVGTVGVAPVVTPVASVTAGGVTTNYTDLAGAITAAKASEGSTLTLLEDITTTTAIEINSGAFTIDLNGKTWQCASYLMDICGNADITIIDSSTEKSGKLLCTDDGCAIMLYDNANLEIAGGTVENNAGWSSIFMGWAGNPSDSTLTVSGGTVKATGTASAISAFGKSVTVTGGTLESGTEDIYYKTGTIDLSGHSNPTGITIYNGTGAEVTPGENTTRLPEGYALLDGAGHAVTTLAMSETYTVGVVPVSQSVKVSAVDAADGSAFAGAHLQILDADGDAVDEWVSAEDDETTNDVDESIHEFAGLKPNETYTLRTVTAPAGYTICADTTFAVDSNGKITSRGTVTEDGVLLVVFEMTETKVTAVDAADGQGIAGATMQIYDAAGNLVEEWISAEDDASTNGVDESVHMVTGLLTEVEYTLRASVTPDGYTIPSDITFSIDQNGNISTSGNKNEDGVLLVEFEAAKPAVTSVTFNSDSEAYDAQTNTFHIDEEHPLVITVEGENLLGAEVQFVVANSGFTYTSIFVTFENDHSGSCTLDLSFYYSFLATLKIYNLAENIAYIGADVDVVYANDLIPLNVVERTYEVELPTVEDATVKTDKENPVKGDKVTITVTPDEGKEVAGVTVTDENGDPVDVTNNGDGTYSYEQPAGDATVTVELKNKTYTVSFDTNGGETIDPLTVTYGEKYGNLPSSAIKGLSGGDSNWYLVDENGVVTESKITRFSVVETTRDHTLRVQRKILAPTLKITLQVPGGISDGYQYYVPGNSTRILTVEINNRNDDVLAYSYQWYKDGTLLDGETESVLTLEGNVSDSGTYRVVVTAVLKDGVSIQLTNESASSEKEQKVKILHAANTLAYDGNGGGTVPGNHYTGGAAITVAAGIPERLGYTFAGWCDNADGTGTLYAAGDTYTFAEDNGNGGCVVTLYAQWTANVYGVVLNTDGGTINSGDVTEYTCGVGAVLPTDIVKSGYTFAGWYDNADFAGEAVTEITAEDYGDKEFFAKWKTTIVVRIPDTPDTPDTPEDPVGDCQQGENCPTGIFTDLDPEEWYHDGIHFCVEESLMNGTSATTFEPATTTSRAMIMTILYRLAGSPAVDAENPFTDVADDTWYTEAVIWAAENGIVDGYGNGKFGPNDAITREQTAKILHSYASLAGKDVTVESDDALDGFGDADAISVWAKDAMLWAVDSGLINGKTGNLLDPKGEASRAEAATMLYRFCELIK